jgi:hypothetical protein
MMDNKNPEYKEVQRYTLASPQSCSLGIVSCQNLMWEEHSVRIMNMSVLGIGIESNQRIVPGLVWFKKRVGGHNFGIMRWVKSNGPSHKAGIEFIDLSRETEEYIQKQVKVSQPFKPVPDPEKIISVIIETIDK